MDELAPYVLQNVQGLKEGSKNDDELDSGAYGVVFKVSVNGLECMAKRLHAILVKDVSKEDKSNIEKRFCDECLLLSQLQHPNIVRFVGVCYLESDLALVMEKLRTDVAAFVHRHANVPIPMQTSIALDVSYGLLYLHNHLPLIIHRDLTAPNILLTNDLRAKIGDLGVSKVLSNPLLVTKTVAPGNVNYMAPETKVEKPEYGTAVDVFSFGHLLIHIAIQDWPSVYETNDHQDMQQGVMERAKRKTALERMGKGHPLHPLAIDCLHDHPQKRPPAKELNKRLADLCTHQYPKSFADILEVTDEEDKSHLTGVSDEQVRETEQRAQQERREFQTRINQLTEELRVLATDKSALTEQLSRVSDESKEKGEQLNNCQAENTALNKDYGVLKEQNLQLRVDMQDGRDRLEATIADTARLHDQVLSKKNEVTQHKRKADSLKGKLEESGAQLRQREKELQDCRELIETRERENEETIARFVEEKRLLEENKEGLTDNLEKAIQRSRDTVVKALEDLHHQFTALRDKHVGPAEGQAEDRGNEANLPGVEVIGQTMFIVTRTPRSFKWEGYGMEIHVPPNCLPPEINRCVLQIYISLSGQYELPGNDELASAVCWVRPIPYCKFAQPVTFNLQHCAKKSSLKNLAFYRAVCTQEVLPYAFKKLEGRGVFAEGSSFGSIKLDHFSGFCIGGENVEKMYTAGLYYLGRDLSSWEVHLVVSWDNEAHNHEIHKFYERRGALKGPCEAIEFDREAIKLDIPMEGVPVGKWTIRPLVRPQLAQKRVDYFKPGRTHPHCQLLANWAKDAGNVTELYYPLTIDGAKEPNNMITIEIDPKRCIVRTPRYSLRGAQVSAEDIDDDKVTLEQLVEHTGIPDYDLNQQSSEEALSMIAQHVPNWFNYATTLKLSGHEIRQIDRDPNLDEGMKAVSTLHQWRRRTGFRATYRRLVQVCLSLDNAELAEKVCNIVLSR